MLLEKNYKISKTGCSFILYDADIITEPTVQLFDVDYHTIRQTQQSGGIGRAQVVYFSQAEKSFVLKHYYRGGAVARISKDYYLGFSVIKSRAFREFRLLKKMHSLGLPVPVAVAAHVKKGLFYYQADLISEEIKQVNTLADSLLQHDLKNENWQEIGRCLKRFHQQDIYHADLNARNILLNEAVEPYLIDFDNSYIRLGSASWKMANLSRLKRSLLKFKKSSGKFNFNESDWGALLEGYRF